MAKGGKNVQPDTHGIRHSDLPDVSTPHAAADLADAVIVNAHISASAAIALSKLATITAGYVVLGAASGIPTATAISGDLTISSTGLAAIASGVIVDADISVAAAIRPGKILLAGVDTLSAWQAPEPWGSFIDGGKIYTGSIPNAALNPLITQIGYYDLSLYNACVYA